MIRNLILYLLNLPKTKVISLNLLNKNKKKLVKSIIQTKKKKGEDTNKKHKGQELDIGDADLFENLLLQLIVVLAKERKELVLRQRLQVLT